MTEGIVNLLKPPGMTSSDAVTDIRKLFGIKRVGHTGTLDPGAAGVLPICIGRATRLFDYLVDKQKEYVAEVSFGVATDTQDSYGSAVVRAAAHVSMEELQSVLPRFTGEIGQIAPMYSAVRVDGKKLYQLARQGAETIERRRDITVYSLGALAQTGENRYLIRMVCSKGTYVRTVVTDIGTELGVPAHMSFLLRTRSGDFRIEESHTLAELARLKEEGRLDEAVVSVERALSMLDAAQLSPDAHAARLLVNGAQIADPSLAAYGEETALRVYANGTFLGIGIAQGDKIHIKLNLAKGEDEA